MTQAIIEPRIMAALDASGVHLDRTTLATLRVELTEHGVYSVCNTQKSNATASPRADRPWGCVVGPKKRATGSVGGRRRSV